MFTYDSKVVVSFLNKVIWDFVQIKLEGFVPLNT